VIPSFTREVRLAHIINQIPPVEHDAFKRIGYTIGGMMVFPGHRVGGKMTINGARGFSSADQGSVRSDGGVIRRHYRDEPSPLSDTLARYADSFDLFGDFAGYVDFFHLQDLAAPDHFIVECFLPFEGFHASPLRRLSMLPGLPQARCCVHRVAQPADRRSRRGRPVTTSPHRALPGWNRSVCRLARSSTAAALASTDRWQPSARAPGFTRDVRRSD
jgi:hypothetical protein